MLCTIGLIGIFLFKDSFNQPPKLWREVPVSKRNPSNLSGFQAYQTFRSPLTDLFFTKKFGDYLIYKDSVLVKNSNNWKKLKLKEALRSDSKYQTSFEFARGDFTLKKLDQFLAPLSLKKIQWSHFPQKNKSPYKKFFREIAQVNLKKHERNEQMSLINILQTHIPPTAHHYQYILGQVIKDSFQISYNKIYRVNHESLLKRFHHEDHLIEGPIYQSITNEISKTPYLSAKFISTSSGKQLLSLFPGKISWKNKNKDKSRSPYESKIFVRMNSIEAFITLKELHYSFQKENFLKTSKIKFQFMAKNLSLKDKVSFKKNFKKLFFLQRPDYLIKTFKLSRIDQRLEKYQNL